jgi:glyoxylase-like metal-dependent hydrolase (beta-lactamase superfamily II)
MLKISKYDGVTRIDSARSIAGRGYYWTTAYLVDGLLIDTGCAHTATKLAEIVQNAGLACIVNTHSHEDHIGANGILQDQRKDVKILAHPLALPVLDQPREAQPLQLYRQAFWGWPMSSHGQPVQDGDLINTRNHCFQVIYTPGHCPDHLCIYEKERGWLFTGDLFVGGRDRAVVVGCDIWQVIASLKQVAVLPLTRLFPGCARTRDNPRDDLKTKIEFLEETGERILELHKRGLSINAIARTLFGNPMLIEFITLGHFTRHNLVRSYLAQDSR